MKYDYKLLYPIKKHLKDIKKKIITSLAWKKNSSVRQIIHTYFEKQVNQNKTNKIE